MAMANKNNFDSFVAGRARRSARAVVCLAKSGAHGVTRPTNAFVIGSKN